MSARAAWRLEQLGFARVFRYTPGKADWAAAGLPMEGSDAGRPRAASAARRDVPTCRPDETASTVRTRLGAAWPACVVVNEHRVVLGLLRRDRLESGSPEARAESLMEEGPATYRPSLPLEQAAEWMRQQKAEVALVTTSDGELIGLLARSDVVL